MFEIRTLFHESEQRLVRIRFARIQNEEKIDFWPENNHENFRL